MAEGVHRRRRVRLVAVVRREQDARGAKRHEGLPGLHHAHPDGRGRVVPRAPRDDHGAHAPPPRELRAQRAGHVRPLHKPRHRLPRQPRPRQQIVRPVPRAGVEPARPRRVRHLGHVLARQPQPQVVLRQQHLRHAPEQRGLVVPDPFELRRREAREHDVPRHAPPHRIGVHRRRLRMAPRVVPEDAGPQHLVRRIQKRRPVHVPRQPDAAHRAQPRPGGEPVHAPPPPPRSSRRASARTSRHAGGSPSAARWPPPPRAALSSISRPLSPDVPRSSPRNITPPDARASSRR